MIFFMVTIILLIIFVISSFFINESSSNEVGSNSPFECGFESFFSSRIPFSIHFFSIVIVFLIFDLEIIIIMPILRLFTSSTITMIVVSLMFVVLLMGLIIEWNEGSLEWNV